MQKLACFTGLLTFTYAQEASLFLVDEPISEIVDTVVTEPAANAISWLGFDISSAMSYDIAACMAGGYTTVIARGFKSSGSVDTNGCASLNNAAVAGIPKRDLYIFPCPKCGDAASQIASMVSYAHANCGNTWSGKIWLDIEGSEYWLGNTTANRTWYESLVNSCYFTAGVTCGVYTGLSQWLAIFGSSSYVYGSNLPLWYAHYDNKADFSDFTAFGGWTQPWGKQYKGTTTACGMGVDVNYIP